MSERAPRTPRASVDTRTGLGAEDFARAFANNLRYIQAKFPAIATTNDHYLALSYTVRDRLLKRWLETAATYLEKRSRTVVYLSAEYLLGPQLGNNLVNLGVQDEVRQAIARFDLDLDSLLRHEEEPGLGNGGLGRLAACYMDSLATLEIPAIAYGIRYEFGIFRQEIRDGEQVELTDKWLRLGNPWEIARPEIAHAVRLGGHTESYEDDGAVRIRWIPDRVILGIAHDTPILGYGVNTANLLRLWTATACESFDFQSFNVGDYYGAIHEKIVSENITKVLYPNDEPHEGKELRLEQQYFLVSCSLQDMIRIFLQKVDDLTLFDDKFAIQLNDTHPSMAIAELMRLLVDEHRMGWEEAWEVTRKTFAFTNHTLLAEALERWPVTLFARLFPRLLEIIYEINRRFLDEVRERYPDDEDRVARMSLIDESGERFLRMAHLACVGSFAVNGVSELHTELLQTRVLSDFHDMWPERFFNITNGVTPRRFLLLSHPRLAGLITQAIGADWVTHLEELRQLEDFADDRGFQEVWRRAKREAREVLADEVRSQTGVVLNPETMFDIQVKRIHEYKRQHLNVLHIVSLYDRIKRDPEAEIVPRSFVFGGKAAPGYFTAKLIIRLIHAVARVVNEDPDVRDRLRVAFLPNYNVKNAQLVYPAADLSEQISTAGKEASGTGNMKFSLGGALTIGTPDGANVEIRREVGEDNFFLFGMTVQQVEELRTLGYCPRRFYETNPSLRRALDMIASGVFSPEDPSLFQPLIASLLDRDEYMLLADYESYVSRQDDVSRAHSRETEWTRKSILNVARMGKFSSDRSVREYCEKIWKVTPVRIELDDG